MIPPKPLDLSFENVHRQYLACRRNKRNTVNALRFECRQEENLLELAEALGTRAYLPSRSVCFVATRPKLREIFAADFRDRIVHHVLVDYLERIWEPVFIHDSYACRRGKGVHKGVLRLRQFIRQVTQNGAAHAWYLQLDIRNFFMNIDKGVLYSLIEKKTKDEAALWLSRLLIFHDCTENYMVKGDPETLKKIPPHKTLFHAPKNRGLPIGNLNSQFFANVYLNGLDQFVKHRIKCRYYVRYCDDFILLSRSRDELLEWRARIAEYLSDALGLELNESRQRLRPVSDGVDFLGYIVRADYLLVRRRVVNNLRERLGKYERLLVKEGAYGREYLYVEAVLDELAAVLSSYLGHLKMADSYSLCQALWGRYPFLARYFDFDPAAMKVEPRYKAPPGLKRARQQYLYWRWRFKGVVVLFQVGSFYEFFHARDAETAALLGLSRMKKNRRGALYGFPAWMFGGFVFRLLQRGLSVVVVRERESVGGGVKARGPLVGYEAGD